MSIDGSSLRNLASNVNKIQKQQQVFFIALLSIACMSCIHAKPYIPPPPLGMFGSTYQQYDGSAAKFDVENADGVVEDTPVEGIKPDVSTPVGYNVPNR